jgi:hypothetical protein
MGRNPQCNGLEPSRHHETYAPAASHDECQWTGPEARGQAPRRFWDFGCPVVELAYGTDMNDERVVRGAALDGEDARHGGLVFGVCAEPIYGLRGEGDKSARPQDVYGTLDVPCFGWVVDLA